VLEQEQGKFPIKIRFRSEQKSGKEIEVSEFATEGNLYKKENFDYLQFKEVINDIGDVNTIIKISKAEVNILRKGSISMNQKFLLNETTTGIYRTPYGPIDMETSTSQIQYAYDVTRNKGTFILKYKMAIQKQQVGNHQIRIDFEGRTQ
jgi:uncharacterized beta-barrel protein YwiB (DUF1934 family)